MGVNSRVRPLVVEPEWRAPPAPHFGAVPLPPRPEIEEPAQVGQLVWPQALAIIVVLNAVGWTAIVALASLIFG